MLHGAVVRPPAVGATVAHVDESSVRNLPGLVKVVVRNNFVGIVADKPWHALQAASTLKVSWTEGTGLPNPARIPRFHAKPKADTRHIPRRLKRYR